MSPSDRRAFLLQTAGTLAGISLVPETLTAEPVRLAEPLKVGLIGAGRQGRAIIAELQKIPGVTIAVVCDTSPARLGTALERAGGATGTPDHRAVLDRPDIGAVILATPTHLHRAIALEAIAAGKPLYLEVPIAHTVEDALAIAAAAEAGRAPVFAGLQGRTNPSYQRARSLVGSDSTRDPVSLYAQYHRKTSWRFPASEPGTDRAVNWRLDPEVSTGLAGEIGTTQFDVAAWLMNGLPARISGSGALRFHHDGRTLPDTVHADLSWDNGVALHWQATLASSYGGQFELLYATNAAIKLAWTHAWLFKEPDSPTQGWEVYATKQQFFNEEGIVLVADATKLAAQGAIKAGAGLPYSSLYYALADFLTGVSRGTSPTVTARDGARATVLGILANQAILTGQTIALPSGL